MLNAGGWGIGGASKPKGKEAEDEGYASSSPPSTPSAGGANGKTGGIQPISQALIAASQAHDGTGLQSVIAKAIAAKAKSASLNRHVDGPFAKEVRRVLPGEDFRGGKRDDICVIVGVVVENAGGSGNVGAGAGAGAGAGEGGKKGLGEE